MTFQILWPAAYELLYNDIKKFLTENEDTSQKRLYRVCQMIESRLAHYDWVGFYILGRPERLFLGPFVGFPTEHIEIPFGRGICGQTAIQQSTMIVPDVRQASNYLACNLNVLSEIVVPVFWNGRFIGEIDIDSNLIDAFSTIDKIFLESVASLVAEDVFNCHARYLQELEE
jgi:L-methionine (R)-S-oxide reductase